MTVVGKSLGHYEILEPLGAGGMGEVYRARDTRLDRDVAIKVLPEDLAADADRLARFEREAKLLAALNHANIGAIHGLEASEGVSFLVLELIEGQTLEQRLGRGALPVPEALDTARQIAEALEAAHDEGIVHRDVKPANVLLTTRGGVKVLDFGIAKNTTLEAGVAATQRAANLTVDGMLIGTPAYMSPEQIRGGETDKRADIWAFGCVLHEMLTTGPAFARETLADTLAAVVDQEPNWSTLPDDTPRQVRHLIERCLRKDPQRRLRDIGDARIEIEDALRAPPGAEADSAHVAEHSAYRRLVPWTSAAVMTIVAAVAVWSAASISPTATQSVTRFVVDDPPLYLRDEGPALALSPDGAKLVYVGQTEGASMLFLRRLDEVEARSIPGTEGGRSPFFSLDGERVAFYAAGQLRQVALRGGTPTTLTSADSWRGGAWQTDDAVLAAIGTRSGLLRIVSGELTEVTTPNVQQGELTHRWPQILPDGQAMLYTVGNSEITSFEDATIVAQPFDEAEGRPLIEGGSYPLYLHPGYLLYARSAALMAVPFDPARLEVAGRPLVVEEGVVTDPRTGAAEVAVAANGTLAYAAGSSREVLHKLTWVDRSGNTTSLAPALMPFAGVRFSPDGRALALSVDGANVQIWILELARGALTQLTTEWSNNYPVWDAEGTHVIFSSEGGALFRKTVGANRTPERLIQDSVSAVPTSVFADGPLLFYTVHSPTTGSDLWSISSPPDGSPAPVLQTPYDETNASISPNGRWLAYVSNETGRDEVYVVSYPDLGGKKRVSLDGGTDPRWRQDSSELFYRTRTQIMVVAVQVDSEFVPPTAQVLFEGENFGFDVAPEGDRLVVIEPAAGEQLTAPVIVVLNWIEELKERMPTGR